MLVPTVFCCFVCHSHTPLRLLRLRPDSGGRNRRLCPLCSDAARANTGKNLTSGLHGERAFCHNRGTIGQPHEHSASVLLS